MNGWLSLHLFYAQPEDADRLALNCSELLRTLTERHDDWFFIRYAEAGAHLRVRLGPDIRIAHDAFRERMANECASLAAGVAVAEWVRAIGYPDPGGAMYAPGALVDIPYVPETRRYGGPHALLEHERLFRLSTAIAIRAIALTRNDSVKRARLALDLMLMTAAASDACGLSPGEFFAIYGHGWKQGLPDPSWTPDDALTGKGVPARYDAHRAVTRSGRTPDSLVTHWGAAVAHACEVLRGMAEDGRLISPIHGRPPSTAEECDRALAGMLFSQMHMMNNRLGFAPHSEMMWSEAIAFGFGVAEPSEALALFGTEEFRQSLGMRASGNMRIGPMPGEEHRRGTMDGFDGAAQTGPSDGVPE